MPHKSQSARRQHNTTSLPAKAKDLLLSEIAEKDKTGQNLSKGQMSDLMLHCVQKMRSVAATMQQERDAARSTASSLTAELRAAMSQLRALTGDKAGQVSMLYRATCFSQCPGISDVVAPLHVSSQRFLKLFGF